MDLLRQSLECLIGRDVPPAVAKDLIRTVYHLGVIKGLAEYAWWKDGIQYVGTCGNTLKQALDDAEKELDNLF